jgi:hypothetical protein
MNQKEMNQKEMNQKEMNQKEMNQKEMNQKEMNQKEMGKNEMVKNVYLVSHGRRIKNSFFKLEPNVNVYMKCTDTPSSVSWVSNVVPIKFLLNNVNIDYLDLIIKKLSSKDLLKKSVTYDSTYNSIQEGIDTKIKHVFLDLIKLKNIYKQKIEQLDAFYVKLKRKINNNIENNKYNKILINTKKTIKKLVVMVVKIEDVIMDFGVNKDDYTYFEKIKSIHKPSYDILQKYKRIKERFERKREEMEHKYRNYDSEFDLCVFSGNLDHKVQKYTHGIICKRDKMDINICPNIEFSADNAEKFRDFICEQGIHIEIKKNDEIYMKHEEIINEVDKYLKKIFVTKNENITSDIINNIGLNILCNKDVKMLKNDIEQKIKEHQDDLVSNEDKLFDINNSIKESDGMTPSEMSLKELYVARLNRLKESKKKILKRVEKIKMEINKMNKFIGDDYEINVNNEEKLFYPMGEWSDCNVKDKFPNIVNKNIHSNPKIFRYYDAIKRRFLSQDECEKKCISERKKYVKYGRTSLRDVLVYLYFRYNMDLDENIRLELTISSCKGEFDVIKDIYNTCKLSLSDYLKRKIKIDGVMMSLREYDLKRTRGKTHEGKTHEGKRVRKSCGSILKKDGCPTYCEMPKDESRKMCIVKSRRRKTIRKKEALLQHVLISSKPIF